MICNVIDKDSYIIKVFNYDNFDIYDHEDIKEMVSNVFNKVLNKYNLCGEILFNIYVDKLYGLIIEVNKIDDLLVKDVIDLKIKFNLNISFLYEVDYFYLVDNNITNQNVYYYKDKFYLETVNDIDNIDYIKLLDNSSIIYDDKINDIIDNGIRLNIMV